MILRFLQRNALRKGLLGGSRPWVVVGVLVWLARKAAKPEADVVYCEPLAAGETLVIAHDRQPS
ncbi:hypothetical protein BH20ACT2_BH20ACT2_21100 [soil metagenome]